jgi:four helix bundle protein
MSIVVEEADESEYWLEIIEGANISCDSNELKRLLKEIDEIIRVVATARKNNS